MARGEELVGLEYEGPFDDLPAAAKSSTASSRGTRSRSRRAPASSTSRPAAGAEDFELARVHDLPVLVADRRVGAHAPGLRRARGLSTDEVEDVVIEDLRERELLVEAGRITHRYPICWRCKTPLVFRVVDDWFISARRGPAAAARRERDGRVDAVLLLEADGRLAAQHGRLEHLAEALLRAAAAVLSVRVRPAERRSARGRSSRSAPRAGSTSCRSCTGPGSTRCRSRARRAGRTCGGSPRSATPGSTRASSRSRRSAGRARSGSRAATRPGPRRDCPGRPARSRVLGAVVPGGLDLGEPRADPALVLLDALHVGDARRPGAVRARARVRACARRARPRDAQVDRERDRGGRGDRADGRRRDALDVLRAGSEPEPQLRLRAGARDQAAAAHALELGQVLRRLRERRSPGGAGELEPLDRWLSRATSSSSPRRPTRTSATGRRT